MIELYMRKGCPFCDKVESAAQSFGMKKDVNYKIVDAAPNTPGREVVLRVGGKPMVPFLVDGEKSMYESDDIIAYLKAQKA